MRESSSVRGSGRWIRRLELLRECSLAMARTGEKRASAAANARDCARTARGKHGLRGGAHSAAKGAGSQRRQRARDATRQRRAQDLGAPATCARILINDKVKELKSTTISADSVRITKDKWTGRSTSTGNGALPLNDKAAMLLDDVIRKFLVPVECLPFHEIICFKNVDILRSALIGNPRRMVQLDLLKSQSRLKCSCCTRNGIAVSASLHDTSIMCNLAQEYGDVINLHDWYLSFDGIINSTNLKVKRKPHSSPPKKKSKATPPQSEAMIQARFCRAVTELQISGLLRMPSKRRPDLLQRIAFGP